METILEVQKVSKRVGKKQILDDVSFSLAEGEILGLVGPNGAGKTTLMKLIAGYNLPTHGAVQICGHDVIREHDKAMREAAFLVEEPGLYPQLSGRDHVRLVLDSRGLPRQNEEALSDLLNFPEQLDKKVRIYSIGMKQRLGLALCWAAQPKLLVLDEPLNGLDPDGIFLLREKMEQARSEGAAVLISSHLLSELQRVATRFLFLDHGRIVGAGSGGDFVELESQYRRLFRETEGGA